MHSKLERLGEVYHSAMSAHGVGGLFKHVLTARGYPRDRGLSDALLSYTDGFAPRRLRCRESYQPSRFSERLSLIASIGKIQVRSFVQSNTLPVRALYNPAKR